MRGTLVPASSFLVLLSVSVEAEVLQCEGKNPMAHNNGTYFFTTESWKRTANNGVFYGRCIKVAEPTTELLNTWECVLPSNAIARKDAPTAGGNTFIDSASINRNADLYYGNADDVEKAVAYYSHRDEQPCGEQEVAEPSWRERINQLIKELGSITVTSNFQFAIRLDGNEASLADVRIDFMSTYDGKSFTYEVAHDLKPVSNEYSGTKLSISFPSETLGGALTKSTGLAEVPVAVGAGSQKFGIDAVGQGEFMRHVMLLENADGEVLSSIPITYFLPAR